MIKQAQDRAGQSEEKYDLSEEVTSPPFPENCVAQPTETYPPPCHSLSSLSWLGQHATTAEYYSEAERYANPLFRFDIKRTFDSPSPSSSSLHNERTAAVNDGAVSGEKSTVTWLSGRSHCSRTDTNQVAFEVKEMKDESPVYLLDKRYASVSSSEVSPCSSALQCLQTWLQQQQPLQRWDASCMKYVSAQCPIAQTNSYDAQQNYIKATSPNSHGSELEVTESTEALEGPVSISQRDSSISCCNSANNLLRYPYQSSRSQTIRDEGRTVIPATAKPATTETSKRMLESPLGASTTTTKPVDMRWRSRNVGHIKKPLNAFMLFMKEMRSQVIAECTLKESAAINQILGRKWHALSREAQAKYYEMAKKEKELHQRMYPGWSARDNYATQIRRRHRATDNPPVSGKYCINGTQSSTAISTLQNANQGKQTFRMHPMLSKTTGFETREKNEGREYSWDFHTPSEFGKNYTQQYALGCTDQRVRMQYLRSMEKVDTGNFSTYGYNSSLYETLPPRAHWRQTESSGESSLVSGWSLDGVTSYSIQQPDKPVSIHLAPTTSATPEEQYEYPRNRETCEGCASVPQSANSSWNESITSMLRTRQAHATSPIPMGLLGEDLTQRPSVHAVPTNVVIQPIPESQSGCIYCETADIQHHMSAFENKQIHTVDGIKPYRFSYPYALQESFTYEYLPEEYIQETNQLNSNDCYEKLPMAVPSVEDDVTKSNEFNEACCSHHQTDVEDYNSHMQRDYCAESSASMDHLTKQ